MIVRNVFLLLAGLLLTAGVQATNNNPITEDAETAKVDVEKSTVKWHGYKVTGEHYGTVQLKDGELVFQDGKLVDGKFAIDMATIVSDDLSGDSKGKLEGHLKSDDFFGVESHPHSTLDITNVVPYTGGVYKVVADLTIKGITKEIKFEAQVKENAGGYLATADIEIDRSEFNVRYGSGSFFDNLGDKTIYDEFEISVEIQTKEAM
ncbi:YceI family protein [Membranihabitans maritimus]|uniref:YceI family protein n=1 Tax=Membranihabitans maritimus TaxID=2904244 RepID=UPI001F3CF3AE|nr:YceI family protein [Membranihabitans maritimus]